MKFLGMTAALVMGFSTMALAGEKVMITDVANRQVEVELPVKNVILGEGRLIYGIAALDRDDPFARIVGWRDDLIKFDPQTYAVYHAKYPEIENIPTFGGVKEGTFDVEQAIALNPGIVIMNLESRGATEDAGLDAKLASVGIPLVYIDFREAAMHNTEPSLKILGQLYGKPELAQELIDFRSEQIEAITSVIARENPEKPVVFVERAAGYSDECCMSFGNENFGMMVEMAGGINMAASIIPGTFGTVNPEQVVASDPDQIIATGANWEASVPGGAWVGLGPNADRAIARQKLAALMDRPAFTGVKAVEDKQVHAVWHQFYNSPYQFVVIQQMAKWLHPDLFPDLDPQAAFRELHERFLPIEYDAGYFVSLTDED
ncbi:ABC transporter substrate-binding protein [Thalassospira sp.]|uniref:ABC transporter substrate-binding protein n=1 Tax=Thalassospira sp. TaxID=1912094 RepID=UPI002733927B|nr:ABC transporter substrate-binding protein [Thalassospira sp.]MDP2699364.1 ABC transporter substrate-binding protein [Thalassospira sp.]